MMTKLEDLTGRILRFSYRYHGGWRETVTIYEGLREIGRIDRGSHRGSDAVASLLGTAWLVEALRRSPWSSRHVLAFAPGDLALAEMRADLGVVRMLVDGLREYELVAPSRGAIRWEDERGHSCAEFVANDRTVPTSGGSIRVMDGDPLDAPALIILGLALVYDVRPPRVWVATRNSGTRSLRK